MVHKSKTRYTEEFKQQMADLYQSGTSVKKLTEECGVVEQTVYKWIKLLSPTLITKGGATVS